MVNKSVTTLIESGIIITSKICYFGVMLKLMLFLSFLLSGLTSFSQVVEEKIQIDTANQIIKVIYKPIDKSTYFYKKVAVYADDTSQVAVEKTYTKLGQNGLYKVYYPNGRLKIKTVFGNNKINGEWTYYDTKGIIITKGIYKEGVKHGYWAYKSLRIYGRYKKGLKNRKWKRYRKNERNNKTEKKYFSHYKNGKLTGGEGFGSEKPIFLYEEKETVKEPVIEYNDKDISKEYSQAISFLTNNTLFRRKIKQKFGGSIKKYFRKEKFSFVLSPSILPLDITFFVKESSEGKILVSKIDSLLKNNSDSLKVLFNGGSEEQNEALYNYSTDGESLMWVFFSKVNQNLLRIDVVKYDKAIEVKDFQGQYNSAKESQKFKILLYFDNQGTLKGAEYEKSQ